MPVGSPRFKAGDKVTYEDTNATVLQVSRGKVTIRNHFGFRQDVKPGKLKKRDV